MIFSFGFFIFITCLTFVPLIAVITLDVIASNKGWAVKNWLSIEAWGKELAVAITVWVVVVLLAGAGIVCGLTYGEEYINDQKTLENNVYYVYEMETVEHPTRLQCDTAERYNAKHHIFIKKDVWDACQKIDTTKMWAKFVRDVKAEESIEVLLK